jgi:LPXTG-motif cell wall-anchored protein
MAEDFEVNGGLPEESENRTFVIVAAGLGGLIVLSMICLGVYALVLQPAQREAAESRPTEIMLTNTAVAIGLTETVEAEQATATPEASDTPFPTSTRVPTNTPTQVVVLPTNTPPTSLPTIDPGTVTAAAEQTATAAAAAEVGTPTSTPEPTATALPTTGFGDEAGLPGMAGLAAVLLAVIFLSRRLRARPITSD